MQEWLTLSLSKIGLVGIWRVSRKIFSWLKPVGLAHDKPLTFMIGEIAYIASQPYVPEREVSNIVIQVSIGNPNHSSSKTVMTFLLKVNSKAPYHVSEAGFSGDRHSYLVPSGGGFSTVPDRDYMTMPVTIPSASAKVGWIRFCLVERKDLTLDEAWNINATIVAVQPDGSEIYCRLPPCELPRATQP
jgi:hypothetical protein